jgi:hypothetical protein
MVTKSFANVLKGFVETIFTLKGSAPFLLRGLVNTLSNMVTKMGSPLRALGVIPFL